MFRLEELSGSLIKQGRFAEAIDRFYCEINIARQHGVITLTEFVDLSRAFAKVLLNPSCFDEVQTLGNQMLQLAIRIPNYVPTISEKEFKKNVKESREANSP